MKSEELMQHTGVQESLSANLGRAAPTALQEPLRPAAKVRAFKLLSLVCNSQSNNTFWLASNTNHPMNLNCTQHKISNHLKFRPHLKPII